MRPPDSESIRDTRHLIRGSFPSIPATLFGSWVPPKVTGARVTPLPALPVWVIDLSHRLGLVPSPVPGKECARAHESTSV